MPFSAEDLCHIDGKFHIFPPLKKVESNLAIHSDERKIGETFLEAQDRHGKSVLSFNIPIIQRLDYD